MTTTDEEIIIHESDLGWALGCSRMGTFHQRRAIPNQDAVEIESDMRGRLPYLAMAVADGHGDKRHDLSHHGAALAVQAAIREMRSFYQNFGQQGSSLLLKRTFQADFPRRVGYRWREAVLEDAKIRLSQEMPNEDEQQAIPSYVRICLTRYGTTLLVLLITSESILLGQIGDGNILLLRESNQIEVPFERHNGLLATETHSLALPDAHQLWQTAVRECTESGMILMATDGLVNAMTEGHLKTFASGLLARIQEFGHEAVAASLPNWLDRFSEQGSGDDITLALAWLHSDLTSTTTSTPFIPEEITKEQNHDSEEHPAGESGTTGQSNSKTETSTASRLN